MRKSLGLHTTKPKDVMVKLRVACIPVCTGGVEQELAAGRLPFQVEEHLGQRDTNKPASLRGRHQDEGRARTHAHTHTRDEKLSKGFI
ncbi:hypothetical protein MHYP_G00041260 [Metynnis hypsauchen]